MTTPKPKPVRAWAIYSRGGVIPRHALTTSCLCVSPKRGKFLVGPGERVIRVTIVPDGTPSQAAEVRRLRRLLREIRWTFEDAARVPPEDIIARQAINAANDVFPHSYGALMSQASLMWRESAARRGEPLGGEHAVACCRATAKDYLKKIDAALRGRRGR